MRTLWSVVLWGIAALGGAADRPPIPDRLVVLTFDDSIINHATLVAPLLKQYGLSGRIRLEPQRHEAHEGQAEKRGWLAKAEGAHQTVRVGQYA